MSIIPVRIRDAVVSRARNRCEYCGLSQLGQEATFHVDHVVPVAADGPTALSNLALACVSCSLRKGARQVATDPATEQDVAIFNPRLDRWSDHYRWDGPSVAPTTATGRATSALLRLNRPSIVAIRQAESWFGRHPPEDQ